MTKQSESRDVAALARDIFARRVAAGEAKSRDPATIAAECLVAARAFYATLEKPAG